MYQLQLQVIREKGIPAELHLHRKPIFHLLYRLHIYIREKMLTTVHLRYLKICGIYLHQKSFFSTGHFEPYRILIGFYKFHPESFRFPQTFLQKLRPFQIAPVRRNNQHIRSCFLHKMILLLHKICQNVSTCIRTCFNLLDYTLPAETSQLF